MSSYSTCIARVFFNIRESRIRGVFRSLNCGEIERIDMIKKSGRDGKNFWCVFIHWKNISQEVRDALEKGEAVTIVYDEPWYWKMTKSNSRKPVRRVAPKMQIGNDDSGGGGDSTPPRVRLPTSPSGGDEWVDAGVALDTTPNSGVAVNLRTETPYTPSTTSAPTTPPPTPRKLTRQQSCKVSAISESMSRDEAAEVRS